ncbi:MAG: hypothetical protein ACRD59_16315 [Candidatus Acidiferrales bacterium]
MQEELEPNGPGSEKRRSTRVMHSASITLKGTDALGRPFREHTKSVMVNCFGCKCQSIYYPAPNSAVILEVRHSDPRRTPRVVPGRIIWVQRPRNYRALYHVGIEFEVPGNVWDIALPPEDWFPSPEDEELVIPVASEQNTSPPRQFVIAETLLDAEVPIHAPQMPVNPSVEAARTMGTLLMSEEREFSARRDSAVGPEDDRQSASIREIVKMAAAEAVAEQVALIRQQIDTHLQQAIDKAVTVLIERVTQFGAPQGMNREPVAVAKPAQTPSNTAADRTEVRPELPAEVVPDTRAETEPGACEEVLADVRAKVEVHAGVRISPDAQDATDLTQGNARQRRAAKRARKAQQKPAAE